MYRVLIPVRVKQDLKKLDKQGIHRILALLDDIALDPHQGTILVGELHNIRKVGFRRQGVDFRVIYKAKEMEKEIHIILIGTRENFYKELKRRLK